MRNSCVANNAALFATGSRSAPHNLRQNRGEVVQVVCHELPTSSGSTAPGFDGPCAFARMIYAVFNPHRRAASVVVVVGSNQHRPVRRHSQPLAGAKIHLWHWLISARDISAKDCIPWQSSILCRVHQKSGVPIRQQCDDKACLERDCRGLFGGSDHEHRIVSRNIASVSEQPLAQRIELFHIGQA
jgi:hypothetical protein